MLCTPTESDSMDTRGQFAPETKAAARSLYDDLAIAAETVTKTLAETSTDSREAYHELLDQERIDAAHEALFASLLEVHVGSVEEFESWMNRHDAFQLSLSGPETVPRRAWHPVRPRKTVTAVSFQTAPEAAVATVRRQAFGTQYRELLEGS